MAACSDKRAAPTATLSRQSASLAAAPIGRAKRWAARPDEREFQAISGQVPGFAGYYLESPGSSTLVVAVADPSQVEGARSAVAALASRKTHWPKGLNIVSRQVQYTFLELDAWRDSVEDRLFQLPAVGMLDNDEAANRITVGAEPGADRTPIAQVMRNAGVPDGAYRIVDWHRCTAACRLVGPVTKAPATAGDNLAAYHRPAEAGRQITYFDAGGTERGCTLTFTGYSLTYYQLFHFNLPGIVTNSHCSPTLMGFDGNVYYQPTKAVQDQNEPGAEFAREWLDPPFQSGGTTRHADALFATGGSQSFTNLIARPYGPPPGPGGGAGSINIDPGNPSWTIWDTDGPGLNFRVDKVGKSTGWTFGSVTNTCISMPGGPGGALLSCQTLANMPADPGDSGSPVFEYANDGNLVTLVGVLWGKDPNTQLVIISSWFTIEFDLSGIEPWPWGS